MCLRIDSIIVEIFMKGRDFLGKYGNRRKVRELEMAKKRNHKVMITDEAIRKVPRVQYKNIPESEYHSRVSKECIMDFKNRK